MIKDIEKYKKLLSQLKSTISKLEQLDVEEQMEGQIELDIPKEPSKNQLLNEHFEYAWKLIPSTKWDVKKKVTKETKIRLYDYTKEQIKLACDYYLDSQNENYRYKRDRFFNDIIFNYLDIIEKDNIQEKEESKNYSSNFNFKGF